jgi:hAT family C-terminal dimerisation region
MARDYLAIPATSCIAECSFSMAGHTDDPCRGSMHPLKFCSLQKLHVGYLDGQINVDSEIMMKYIGNFDFDEGDYYYDFFL